jgi:FMN phosphatase YigB (HAD superfamily)
MIDTILFDLDGTLLQFSQDAFINAYFAELGKLFTKMNMDAGASIKALWVGTKAMTLNDGSQTNAGRFWTVFKEAMDLTDEKCRAIEAACDDFYVNEFDSLKSIMTPNNISKRLVHSLKAQGYNVVLATNPLFPVCAVETRLRWVGLRLQDFLLVTNYNNSTYCKPNPEYYREIFAKINKKPEQCLMVGNNTAEDMSAGTLGAETFLVTDCLENDAGIDITAFRHGTLAELEVYLLSGLDT